MEIIKDLFTWILVSIPIIFTGFLYDDWGSKRGYFRSSRDSIVVSTIVLCILKPLTFQSTSWWIYVFLLLVGATLGVHGFDRRETWYKGTFWWKREESMRKYKKKKNTENNNSAKDNIRFSTKQKKYIEYLRKKSQKKQRVKYSD